MGLDAFNAFVVNATTYLVAVLKDVHFDLYLETAIAEVVEHLIPQVVLSNLTVAGGVFNAMTEKVRW